LKAFDKAYDLVKDKGIIMAKLSELDICKHIAEIESDMETLEQFAFFDDEQYQTPFYLKQKEKVLFKTINNPVKDDALCFRLIKKHEIVKVWESYDQLGWYYTDLQNYLNTSGKREAFLVDEHGDNEAALLAIIELNKSNDLTKSA
jgi:hypothetical protein